MSMVTVHGPNTMYSRAVTANATGTAWATVNPTNGLIWTLVAKDQSRPAADYDWVYTGSSTGGPASPIADTKNPAAITFAAGAHTVTLTLGGVAQPSFVINAVAGTGPQTGLLMAPGEDEEPPFEPSAPEEELAPESPEVPIAFDPAAHTVAEVEGYADEHPDQVQELLDAEMAGKNRVSLVTFLEDRIPFDPGEHTVTEVIGYVEDNPDQLEAIIAAEEAGKERVTLLTHLESMRET